MTKSLEQIVKEGQEAYRELHGEVCPAIGDGESFLASFAQKVVEGVRENVIEHFCDNRECSCHARLAQFSGGERHEATL